MRLLPRGLEMPEMQCKSNPIALPRVVPPKQNRKPSKDGTMSDKAMEVKVGKYPVDLPPLAKGWGWAFIGDNPEGLTTGSDVKGTKKVLTSPGIAIAIPLDEKIALQVQKEREITLYVWDGEAETAVQTVLKGAVAMTAKQFTHDGECVRGAYRNGKVQDENLLRESAARVHPIGRSISMDGVEGSTSKAPFSKSAYAAACAESDAAGEAYLARYVKLVK